MTVALSVINQCGSCKTQNRGQTEVLSALFITTLLTIFFASPCAEDTVSGVFSCRDNGIRSTDGATRPQGEFPLADQKYANMSLLVLSHAMSFDPPPTSFETPTFRNAFLALGIEGKKSEVHVEMAPGRASVTGNKRAVTVEHGSSIIYTNEKQERLPLYIDNLGQEFLDGLSALRGVETNGCFELDFNEVYRAGALIRGIALASAGALPALRSRFGPALDQPVKIVFGGGFRPYAENADGYAFAHVNWNEDGATTLVVYQEPVPNQEWEA